MMTEAHTLYALGTGSGLIDGIQDQNLDHNAIEMLIAGDGKVDAEFAAMLGAAPIATFRTGKIAQALGIAGIDGLGFTTGVTMFLQARDNRGTLKGATSHLKMTPANGILVPSNLSANHNDENGAVLEMMLYITSADGTTHPVAIAASQSLAGSPAVDEAFTLGSITVNGTAVEPQGVTVDFGIDVQQLGAGGTPYPTFACIQSRRPTISVQTLKGSLLNAGVTNVGAAVSSTVVVTLASIAQGGVRGGTDVTLTLNEGRASWRSIGGGQGDNQTMEVAFTPTYDGTNAVIVLGGV